MLNCTKEHEDATRAGGVTIVRSWREKIDRSISNPHQSQIARAFRKKCVLFSSWRKYQSSVCEQANAKPHAQMAWSSSRLPPGGSIISTAHRLHAVGADYCIGIVNPNCGTDFNGSQS